MDRRQFLTGTSAVIAASGLFIPAKEKPGIAMVLDSPSAINAKLIAMWF